MRSMTGAAYSTIKRVRESQTTEWTPVRSARSERAPELVPEGVLERGEGATPGGEGTEEEVQDVQDHHGQVGQGGLDQPVCIKWAPCLATLTKSFGDAEQFLIRGPK